MAIIWAEFGCHRGNVGLNSVTLEKPKTAGVVPVTSAVQEYPVPEQLDDPIFREIFDYWRTKCRGERLPARKDIDPTDIGKVLGSIVLIEVLPGTPSPRFRYRLWGTRVTELYGKDYTGYMFDQVISPASREKIQDVFEWVIENRTPHFWQVPVPAENRDFVSNRRLLLPLATDGRTVDMLLAVIVGDRRG